MSKINNKSSKVKLLNFSINLLEFIEKIVNSGLEIEITSTWFTNLNLPYLNAVKLEGEDVNLGDDWEHYKSNPNSQATSLGLYINIAPFNGLKMTLSNTGDIYILGQKLDEEKALQLANLITSLFERP